MDIKIYTPLKTAGSCVAQKLKKEKSYQNFCTYVMPLKTKVTYFRTEIWYLVEAPFDSISLRTVEGLLENKSDPMTVLWFGRES